MFLGRQHRQQSLPQRKREDFSRKLAIQKEADV